MHTCSSCLCMYAFFSFTSSNGRHTLRYIPGSKQHFCVLLLNILNVSKVALDTRNQYALTRESLCMLSWECNVHSWLSWQFLTSLIPCAHSIPTSYSCYITSIQWYPISFAQSTAYIYPCRAYTVWRLWAGFCLVVKSLGGHCRHKQSMTIPRWWSKTIPPFTHMCTSILAGFYLSWFSAIHASWVLQWASVGKW